MAIFVLVHGSYQGGWIWQKVAARLRAAGHVVYAPSMEGCAERRHQLREGIDTTTHGLEIAELLYHEDLRDVVLVGTSSGGMAVCRAAEQVRERIARLVFLDALALFNGEKIRDIVNRSAPAPYGLAAGPSREDAAKGVFADLEPSLRDWVLDRYTPHPVGVSMTPVKLTDFWEQTWNATVIWCRGAPNPGEAHQRRTAERLKARWYELDTGHYPMLSLPDDTARLISQG